MISLCVTGEIVDVFAGMLLALLLLALAALPILLVLRWCLPRRTLSSQAAMVPLLPPPGYQVGHDGVPISFIGQQ